MNRLKEYFAPMKGEGWNGKLLFPVIHVEAGNEFESGYRNTRIALENGADGVFLIAHRAPDSRRLTVAVRDIRNILDRDGVNFPVGVNYLDLMHDPAMQVYEAMAWGEIPMVWSDNPHGREEIETARQKFGWNGIYFGAVAFKYQNPVTLESLPFVAQQATWMDVLTTSGEGTGEAIDLDKAKVFASAVPSSARAVASGVTVENLSLLGPYFDAFLVASSVLKKGSWHDFEPTKLAELASEKEKLAA